MTAKTTSSVGFDVPIVCGFAFDPHVSEKVKRYGKLTVLPAKMNPDLAIGDELLKKTGARNLFMVFGEPDVDIAKGKVPPHPRRHPHRDPLASRPTHLPGHFARKRDWARQPRRLPDGVDCKHIITSEEPPCSGPHCF